jgi:hypothetical protein
MCVALSSFHLLPTSRIGDTSSARRCREARKDRCGDEQGFGGDPCDSKTSRRGQGRSEQCTQTHASAECRVGRWVHHGEYQPQSTRLAKPNFKSSCTVVRDNSDILDLQTGITSNSVSMQFVPESLKKIVRDKFVLFPSRLRPNDLFSSSRTDLRRRRLFFRGRLLVQGRDERCRRRDDWQGRTNKAVDFYGNKGTEGVGHQLERTS